MVRDRYSPSLGSGIGESTTSKLAWVGSPCGRDFSNTRRLVSAMEASCFADVLTQAAMRTYLCLPGAWMGAWSWKFVLERLHAAGHDARALPFRGVGERAAELAPDIDNDVFLADTIAYLERENLHDVV